MNKLQYLRQTFARTSGKTFENYVITQVWAGVKKLGLYPVTQQYVKRPDGYALIDLYFPQINFGVEVNENFHRKQFQADELRMEEIFSAIKNIDVKCIEEADFDQVEGQVSQAIKAIEIKVKQQGGLSWSEDWQEQEYQAKLQKARERGVLSTSDLINFTRIQVANDIYQLKLSEGYLKFGRSFFMLKDNNALWFPHLTKNKQWENSINQDWTLITEKPLGDNTKPQKHTHRDILRHTFARSQNSLGQIAYRFIGIFQLRETSNQAFVYHRVSDRLNLQTWIFSSSQ